MAPAVGFGGSFPCVWVGVKRVFLGNQAESAIARANYFTAVCWQVGSVLI